MIFTKKNNIIGFLILLWSNFAICQNKSIPYSFQKDCSDSIKNALISSYYHPGLNKQDLEDEDRLTSNNRVAQFIELRIDPNQEGTRNSVKKLNKIWRHLFTLAGAEQISIRFSELKLSSFGYFFIYNPTKTEVYGPYTWKNNLPTSDFITPFVEDDSVIVELYEFDNGSVKSLFKIDGLYYGYKSNKSVSSIFFDCSRSIWCAEGYEFQAERRSVVKLLFPKQNMITSGTGVFVNNNCGDGRLLILTSYHLISDSDCSFFNWENQIENSAQAILEFETTCGSEVNTWSKKLVGGLHLVGYCKKFDLALFEVKNYKNPGDINYFPDKSKVYLAGWDANFSLNSSTEAAVIHHINGEPKKISINYSFSGINSFSLLTREIINSQVQFSCNPDLCDGYRFYVNNYSALAPGSSGAPIFDRFSKKVFGILARTIENNNNACLPGYSWESHSASFTKIENLNCVDCNDIWNELMVNEANMTSCEGIEYSMTIASNICDHNGNGGTGWNNYDGDGCDELLEYDTSIPFCAERCIPAYLDNEVYNGHVVQERWPLPDLMEYSYLDGVNPDYETTISLDGSAIINDEVAIYSPYNYNINDMILAFSSFSLETSPTLMGQLANSSLTEVYNGGTVAISNTFIPSDGSNFYINTYRPCYKPITNTDGMLRLSESIGQDTLNYNGNQLESFNVYPNPSKGFFYIEKPNGIESFDIKISNLHGGQIYEIKSDTNSRTEINISNCSNGVYFISITPNKGKIIYRKLILAK